MPGGASGLDLASHVRVRHPAVPILFTTGRPDVMTGAVTLGDNSFLIRKPYSAAEVLDRMRLLELQP